ncbi:MAG: hypothetical protein ACREII_08835 [Nitrospiraceae bacterium]
MDAKIIYIHYDRGRQGRAIDASTEQFVNEPRMGASAYTTPAFPSSHCSYASLTERVCSAYRQP